MLCVIYQNHNNAFIKLNSDIVWSLLFNLSLRSINVKFLMISCGKQNDLYGRYEE